MAKKNKEAKQQLKMPAGTLTYDCVTKFGDSADGSIQIPVVTNKEEVVEVSYFYGNAKPKSIIVISTQTGCPMLCRFCELGLERPGRNLTVGEILSQVTLLWQKEVNPYSGPFKLTLANTGEPLLNPNIVPALRWLDQKLCFESIKSFKVSTVFPKGKLARKTLEELAQLAAQSKKPIQLQISLLSTCPAERKRLSKDGGASFQEIANAGSYWREITQTAPRQARKINLSLMLEAVGFDRMMQQAENLSKHFHPDHFRIRLRPYVPTSTGAWYCLDPLAEGQYQQLKTRLSEIGYEVGDWGVPTAIEQRFSLAPNVTRRRYLEMVR